MRDFIIEDPENAEWVLVEMRKILSRFGFVSRADLYTLVDLPVEYADEKKGWRELINPKIIKAAHGVRLELPPEEDLVFDWTKRAIQHGAGIVPRVLTEQYLKTMKALGFEAVNLVSDDTYAGSKDERYGRNNGKVFCGRDGCIVDSDEKTGFYSVHRGDCSLNDLDFPGVDPLKENRNQRKEDYTMGKFTPPPKNPGPNPNDRSKRNDPPPGKTDRRGDGRDNLPPERPKNG